MSGGLAVSFGNIFRTNPKPIPEAKKEPTQPVTPEEPTREQLIEALCSEAKKWVGVQEKGGNNRGPEVEMFQKAVDGKASREAWCMCAAQFIIKQVESKFGVKSKIYKSEHCLTTYGNTPKECRIDGPEHGCMVIWRHGESSSGHVGIIDKASGDTFYSWEGNTSPSEHVERDGDGFFYKKRSIHGSGDMKVWGYLRIF